jgi:ABC-2 type transport system permease protein
LSSSQVRETDRGMWRVVAGRDFRVRMRDKGFVISTAITLGVLTIFILIRAYGGGGKPTFDLGYVGDASLATQAAAVAAQQGIVIHPHSLADVAAARAALEAGSVDAVLEAGPLLVSKEAAPAQLASAVEEATVSRGIEAALVQGGLPPDKIAGVLNPAPVPVRTLQTPDPNRATNAAVALVGMLLLYGQLFGYGVWVATGVIEEKASRVVEILLSTIRSRQLLAGKILGIGALGLLQLSIVTVYAIILAWATGAVGLHAHAVGAAVLVLFWFVLGFAFYAALFAVAGSLVSRMEELQNVIVPLNLAIVASLFISLSAVQDPGSTLARVASIFPFSAALTMPVRMELGSASVLEIAASIVLLVGSTVGLVPLAGRLYSGAVLHIGAKVKLRDAWRTAS